jgi:hypothetical protein
MTGPVGASNPKARMNALFRFTPRRRRLLPIHRAATALFASASIGAAPQAVTPNASFEPGSAVAVIVKVPKPWYAPRVAVVGKMRDVVTQYEALPGLAFKAFSIAQADGHYGGIYLWKDSAVANAWFSPAWFERVEKERGAKADVRSFEVLVAIDNTPGGTPFNADSSAVATLVTIPTPQGIDKQRLLKEFEAAIPTYQKVPGLLRKYFIVTDDGQFGGIYLWNDLASARQWFSDAWKERVRKTYAADAMIEWFDTPILLPSKLADNRVHLPGL